MSKLLTKEYWKIWAEVNKIPEEELDSWHHTFHCHFCGAHGCLKDFTIKLPDKINRSIIACPQCREYKGVEPCIEEYCECWYLNVIRELGEKIG